MVKRLPLSPLLLAAIRRALMRRWSRLGGVLLAGSDFGQLATLELLLERDVTVATIEPSPRAIRPFVERPPALLVLDAGTDLAGPSAFVRSVREHLPATALMVLTTDVERARQLPELAAVPAANLVVKSAPLDELLRRIVELLPRQGDDPAPAWPIGVSVVKALEHVATHYGEALTVSDVARAAGLSSDRLAHVFRDALGMAVMDYVMRLRVAIARPLLHNPDLTLEDVEQLAGFTDASHFSRVFAGAVGARPGEYRRQPRAWPQPAGLV